MSRIILALSCPDRVGIVAAVAGLLVEHDCNIVESAQFGDEVSEQFFMRLCVDSPRATASDLRDSFSALIDRFAMRLAVHDMGVRGRVLVMASRFGHCLNDLLYRHRIRALPGDIVAVVSNHRDFYRLVAEHDIPFHHLPVTPETRQAQEQRLLELVREERCDLVVLARYMQVLSPAACTELQGRAINIHHSFLPSFQGAGPYRQAHDRGVKLIGATAHYVTEDLDEGPIIEQDVARVDHSMTVEDYASVGREIESAVLARAVKWHLEHRVLVHGARTVVFR
jgi:formyltetrahydrofolate deformylase